MVLKDLYIDLLEHPKLALFFTWLACKSRQLFLELSGKWKSLVMLLSYATKFLHAQNIDYSWLLRQAIVDTVLVDNEFLVFIHGNLLFVAVKQTGHLLTVL